MADEWTVNQLEYGLRMILMGGAGIGEQQVPRERRRAEGLLKLVVGVTERLSTIDVVTGTKPVRLYVEDQLGYGALQVGPNDLGELVVLGSGKSKFDHATLRRVLGNLESEARTELGLADPAAFAVWLAGLEDLG